MKFIPSLFILGTLATSTVFLSGCSGGSSSGGIKQPQTSNAKFTFTNISAPAGDDALVPFATEGRSNIIARFDDGTLRIGAYLFESDTRYRYFSFYRETNTATSPPVGTTFELTDEGPNRLSYFVRNEVDGYPYNVLSGKATVIAKKGTFVTIQFKNLVLRHVYRDEDYSIRFTGTLTYDESLINVFPTGVKLPKN